MSSPGACWFPHLSYLPVLVFFAETCVVTLCTLRTIFLTRGWRGLAASLGFFEVSIWLFAISQVMNHLSSPDCYVAFAGGFALGNYLGVSLEKKLAIGQVAVRVTTRRDPADLVQHLGSAAAGVTAQRVHAHAGPAHVVLAVVRRRELSRILDSVRRFDDGAFYSVHDLQAAAPDVLPRPQRRLARLLPVPLVSG